MIRSAEFDFHCFLVVLNRQEPMYFSFIDEMQSEALIEAFPAHIEFSAEEGVSVMAHGNQGPCKMPHEFSRG